MTQDNTSQINVPSITPALVASFPLRNSLLLLNTEELAMNVLEIN